ncbi:MAG: ATP-binding protein [bacterium]
MYKILLVDDQDSILKAYQSLLEAYGFTVITASSPQEGLKTLEGEQHPVVIITDIKFPSGIDGFEFIRWVKKAYPNYHEVIVISGHATMDLVIEAIHLDASDFIPKPCELNLMLLAIKRASQKIEMRQTIKEYTEGLEYMVKKRTDEIKHMEEQLVQAAKLSAMGELAASVCHELRQPLCGIMGFSYLAGRELGEESPALPYLKKLDEQCERMREIIENLRAFSRQSDASLEVMNIHDALEDAISLFHHQLKNHGIELEENVPADLPPVLGNKTKLQQVFVNLISNARDALDAQNKTKPKKITIRCEADDRNKNIRIFVADNGIGIDESIRSRVFDSFFSTKSVEQGTGLGLSIARTIISDHNGEINFSSDPHEGTLFVVRLPVTGCDQLSV